MPLTAWGEYVAETEILYYTHYRGDTCSKRKKFEGSATMFYDEVKNKMDKLDKFMLYRGHQHIATLTWNEEKGRVIIDFRPRV